MTPEEKEVVCRALANSEVLMLVIDIKRSREWLVRMAGWLREYDTDGSSRKRVKKEIDENLAKLNSLLDSL